MHLLALAAVAFDRAPPQCTSHQSAGTVAQLEQAMPALDSPWAAAGRQLAVGTGVGIFATCFNAPFDVVKSR